MLDKKQAEKITQWENQQEPLMKYGQFAKSPLTREEIVQLVPERTGEKREKFVNNVIPSPCVICLYPKSADFWMQVKGWYGQEKGWVHFSPNSEEERKTYLAIAKKHISEPIKEEINYFNY